MIEVVALSKYFGTHCVFNNYHNRFYDNKICIEGRNGLGKTTLFALIAGVDEHYTGEVLFDGKRGVLPQQQVALASDKICFPAFLTAEQVLNMTRASWHCEWPDLLIERLHLTSFLTTRVRDLSSGNQKKLQLINAMMRNTPYLLLDEPSAALDKHGVDTVLQWLEAYQGQVLISNHNPEPFIDIGFTSQPLFTKPCLE